jgi:anti-sigma factor ChrR (cupin superfamily)
VKSSATRIKELAALHALGALDGEDQRALAELLTESGPARRQVKAFEAVAEALAGSLPAPLPSPGLRESILKEAQRRRARAQAEAAITQLVPQAEQGLSFLKSAENGGWNPLSVAGAFVKLLSFDRDSGYAVVLGKLDPGARYPSHTHCHPEDIFMLSGDLHVGDQVIRSGDFHHAEAGSRHPVNWSETGCVLICVLSKEDLLNQLVPA